MKTIYHYNSKHGFTHSTKAELCPETERLRKIQKSRTEWEEGEEEIQPVYLIPARATEIEPPKVEEEGKAAFFKNGSWVIGECEKPKTKEQVDLELKEKREKAQQEFLNNLSYADKRRMEYPPIEDYLDAVVKGDEVAIKAYVDACNAVKSKYPKTEA